MSLDAVVLLKIRQKEMREFSELLESVFGFEAWGFQESYIRIDPYGTGYIVYDSEWCRVKFNVDGGDLLHGYDMSVMYGRAHAPNEESIITYDGEECWCWHRVHEAFYFLDGLSPQETIDRFRIHRKFSPDVLEQFMQSEAAQRTSSRLELKARMHAATWGKYGKHLFELFDLRHPDLWEQYVSFTVEYYKINGLTTHPSLPAYDKIC